MATNPAFLGHGTFCYLAEETMRHYSGYPGRPIAESGLLSRMWQYLTPESAASTAVNPDGLVRAIKDMGMSHVWVRLFGLEGVMPVGPTRSLIAALSSAGVHVAGWGYCHGRDWRNELRTAVEQSQLFGLTGFVADIEPGRLLGGTRSKWELDELGRFVDGLVAHFGSNNLGISTWPVLKIQNDSEFPSVKLMSHVADRVAMFAPQAYWMAYPKQVHYDATGFREADYPRNDPSSFVRLVVDSWRALGINRDLVVTGQAYWGENSPAQSVMEAKLRTFATGFKDWPKIIGFNWWHAGGRSTMSRPMIDALVSAKLGQKPFRSPDPLVA